jgi:hypothetical protein
MGSSSSLGQGAPEEVHVPGDAVCLLGGQAGCGQLAYFGGLRTQACMKLKLEQIIRHADGYTITHSRAKQRSDKKSTKSVVPQEGVIMTGCIST